MPQDCHICTQKKKYCKTVRVSEYKNTNKKEVKGYLSRGMQVPIVTIPYPHTQGFGQGRGGGCWDTMWMKEMGGATEVHAECEAAGGGREERRERKDGAVVKGDPSAFVQHILAQDLR